MEALLKVDCVTQRFGGLVALNQVSMHINKGEIVGVIGPNGAGKTTLFNIVTGIYQPSEGYVFVEGRNTIGLKPFEVTSLGLGRTFQNIRLFNRMTVQENVMMGMHCRTKANLFQIIFNTKKNRQEYQHCRERADEILKIFDLQSNKYQMPSSLPYGAQRRLEIARALATEPKLLLLDEPAAGMNEQETLDLRRVVRQLCDMGFTIVLIEHDMKFVMNICERIYVLNYGTMIAQGTPREISSDPQVIKAYLGSEGD